MENSEKDLQTEALQNFIAEETLLELLGMPKTSLASLRHKKGFPYIRVTDRVRVYREKSVVDWLRKNERVSDES
jgi:hypothetical protein